MIPRGALPPPSSQSLIQLKKSFMGLIWELTMYNYPTGEMPKGGRQRLPLKRARVQLAGWWRPHKRWPLRRKKYFQLGRSRDDSGVGVVALLSARPAGWERHSQGRPRRARQVGWERRAHLGMASCPFRWGVQFSEGQIKGPDTGSLDFLVSKGGLNSEARGWVELEQRKAETHWWASKTTQWEKVSAWNRVSHPFRTLHSVHPKLSSTPGTVCLWASAQAVLPTWDISPP